MWKGLPLTFYDLTKCEIDFLGCVTIRYGCMAANCKTNGEDMFYVKIILAIASALLCLFLFLHGTIPSSSMAFCLSSRLLLT